MTIETERDVEINFVYFVRALEELKSEYLKDTPDFKRISKIEDGLLKYDQFKGSELLAKKVLNVQLELWAAGKGKSLEEGVTEEFFNRDQSSYDTFVDSIFRQNDMTYELKLIEKEDGAGYISIDISLIS